MDLNNGQRKAIRDFELGFDKAESWAVIEKRMEKKKKRRFFFWIIFGLLGIGAWAIWSTQNSGDKKQFQAEVEISHEEKVEYAEKKSHRVGVQSETISNINLTQENKDLDAELRDLESYDVEKKQALTTNNFASNIANKEYSSKEEDKSSKKAEKAEKQYVGLDAPNGLDNVIAKSINLDSDLNMDAHLSDGIKSIKESKGLSGFRTEEGDEYRIVEKLKKLETNFIEIESYFPEGIELPIISSLKINHNKSDRNKKKNEIMIFANYGKSFRNLNGNSASVNSLVERKNEIESVMDYIGIEVGYRKKLSNNLRLSAHVSYNQITENLEFNQSNLMNLSDVDPDQLPADLKGKNGIAIFKNNVDVYNRFNLLDVDLGAAYIKKMNRFSVGLAAHIGQNMHLGFNGYQSISNRDLERNPSIYKTSIGIYWSVSTIISYRLNDHFSLEMQPSYKQYLNPFNNDNNPVETRFSSAFIKFGSAYMF